MLADETDTEASSPPRYSLPQSQYYQSLSNFYANYRCQNPEMNAFSIELANIEADGRTTVMIRNIPNKYTEGLLLELFNKNHKKKIDFFYLPIDYKVIFLSFSRIIVMLATLSSTSFIQSSLSTFTLSSITKSGNYSTPKRFVIFATPVFKGPTNFLITLRLPSAGSRKCE
jgi:hypothetical protein